MRHLKAGRRLGLKPSHRKAMINNMVTSLMQHGRIRTTEARAKELRKVAERIITLAKRIQLDSLSGLEGTELATAKAKRVHAIRMARRWITDRDILTKVFTEYSSRYAQRPGGYTRILKLGSRPGDKAKMALIELVTEAYPPPEAEKAAEPVAEPVAEASTEASAEASA
jgi:large subunit ribosomal protein L17